MGTKTIGIIVRRVGSVCSEPAEWDSEAYPLEMALAAGRLGARVQRPHWSRCLGPCLGDVRGSASERGAGSEPACLGT